MFLFRPHLSSRFKMQKWGGGMVHPDWQRLQIRTNDFRDYVKTDGPKSFK